MADFFKKLMGKKEPEPTPEPEPEFELPELDTGTPDTSKPDFVEIGGSPVPGLTLRHVLRGHTGTINRIAWSPDGKYLASPSEDKTIRIWDVSKGECVRILEGHKDGVICVKWSRDGFFLASGSKDRTILMWDISVAKISAEFLGHSDEVYSLEWLSGKNILVSGSRDKTVRLWQVDERRILKSLNGHTDMVFNVTSSPDGKYVASGSVNSDKDVIIWDTDTMKLVRKIAVSSQHVTSLVWNKQIPEIAIGLGNGTIELWNPYTGNHTNTLEGHTTEVTELSFSSGNYWLASKSADNTVRLWRTKEWAGITKIPEHSRIGLLGLAFHPHLPILATLGENDTIIRIWELDEAILLGQAKENVNYTTAKLVLVGDSGVGKTGLGWRLAHGEFKEHASTHGQQFWSIPELGLKRKDGTDCEAVLWDLAGQHVYRQVHSIFLENVAAALVLFDPSNRQDPLKGAQFWLEQLKEKGKLPPTVLVGARVDRGAPALSQADLDQFCQRYGITGGYLSTSAMSGEGLEALLEKLKAQIPWEDMTATVTTVTFKRIKDYVLALKEKTDRKGVLVSPQELRALLEKTSEVSETSEVWTFTDAEMMTAVGHLETHGYVSILHNSAGETYILLTPELLVNIAASIMLLADKNPKELGAISETELLKGKLAFDELKGLEKSEQQILLDAAVLRFLEHNICFRDTFGEDTLLIFPSLIKQKRPLQQDESPATDDISYVVRGRIENIYASLVVLLGYTPTFSRINQWQNQAQYVMKEGEICGFRLTEDHEGEIELVLYYADSMPQTGRDKFQELFEQFLYQRDVEVTRFPPAVCPQGHPLERNTFVSRMREGQKFVFCYKCDKKVPLPILKQSQTIGIDVSPWLQREGAVARLRSTYEKHLTNIKSYRRTWAAPRVHLSCSSEQKDWATRLIHDLQDAGVYIVEQPEKLNANDFVIVLDTSAYQKEFLASAAIPAMQAVQARLGSNKILSLACEGKAVQHPFEACQPGNFCDETHYPVSLYDLVLNLYAIPLDHKGFEPLRQSLHEQWETTLSNLPKDKKGLETMAASKKKPALKVFISYSHKDEKYKNELVTMLGSLQRRGIIDPWQDRKIREGEEWQKEIEKAMKECDMAILLISADFLSSPFIQTKELPRLLKRRAKEGLLVVPIIVRECLWKDEPVLKNIQVLPKDGKPVVKFPKANGARDQVWTDIATAIEKRTKK